MDLDIISKEIANEIILDKLKPEERDRILSIKDGININDEQSIMKLGAEVSKEITALNKTVLSTVKIKDIPEIESILPQLNAAFKDVDSSTLLTKKQGFFARLIRGDQVQEFMNKFENAETVVANIQSNLQRVEMELRKDIELEDSLGQRNIKYVKELTDHIVAMKLKLNDSLIELEEKQKNVNKNDFVELQLLEEEKDKIDSLDKQIFWLEQQRLLAIQTLPILRNLKNNNKDMIRQISLTVQQSIPAWEQGIIIAFHIHRQQGALRIERAVHDMTNQLVKQNSQLLKENSIEIVKAVQGGMIDIETFREANKNLIETSQKITEAKNMALKSRSENIQEYRKLTEQLLEAEKRDILKLASTSMNIGELHG